MRTGLAVIGIVFGCLLIAACGSGHPTNARMDTEQHYSAEKLPFADGYGGSVEMTTQSDTTTQRGIGGFGSGN